MREARSSQLAGRLGADFGQLAALLRKHRMLANARELTQRLRALPRGGGFEIAEYVVFPHTDHAMAAWPALARGIPFAFPER